MKGIKYKFYTIVLILTTIGIPSLVSVDIKSVKPGPFFNVAILVPNSCSSREFWVPLLPDNLAEIGINVSVLDHTGWSNISPRVWGYPGPYPVPSYAEGGYDILALTFTFSLLDWDPTEFFRSNETTPNGDNFYQYTSIEFDSALEQYRNSTNLSDRFYWGYKLQDILYEDLPLIAVAHTRNLYPMDINFDLTSWNGILWSHSFQTMENWSIPGQTEFHYATPADFEDFHIFNCEEGYDAQWLHQIYTGMFQRNPLTPFKNNFAPNFVSSYSSNDGLNYSITLDSNAKWADGTSIESDDIQFSYNLTIQPDFGNSDLYDYWIQYIDNSSITIVNSTNLTIDFLEPYIFQESNLGLPILPEHIWNNIAPENMSQQAELWASTNPNKLIGAGPYYLENYNELNNIIHLTINPYFDDWTGISPKFTDIYFETFDNKLNAIAALEQNNIDMIDSNYWVKEDEIPAGTKYSYIVDSDVSQLAINNKHPIIGTGELCPIASPESAKYIRQAISHVIPRVSICNELYDGYAIAGITACPATATVFNPDLDYYEYNITKARELMPKGGFGPISTVSVSIGLYTPIFLMIISFILIEKLITLRKK